MAGCSNVCVSGVLLFDNPSRVKVQHVLFFCLCVRDLCLLHINQSVRYSLFRRGSCCGYRYGDDYAVLLVLVQLKSNTVLLVFAIGCDTRQKHVFYCCCRHPSLEPNEWKRHDDDATIHPITSKLRAQLRVAQTRSVDTGRGFKACQGEGNQQKCELCVVVVKQQYEQQQRGR